MFVSILDHKSFYVKNYNAKIWQPENFQIYGR